MERGIKKTAKTGIVTELVTSKVLPRFSPVLILRVKEAFVLHQVGSVDSNGG